MNKLRAVNGFSLVELVVTVAIIGFITAIGMVGYAKIMDGARKSIAWDKAEILNLGLKKYSQIVHDMPTAADPASTDVEFLVLRSLQWKDPSDPSVGAPYIRLDYNPAVSSSVDDFRIRWNGFVFEVLNPGDTGSGLQISDSGSDITTNYSFPTGYNPQ
jgi:prepilin-type N-terminal cleavage/methylation domain-containing protein